MFHILGFLFFIVIIILVIGLAILSKVIRTFLGLGRKMTNTESSFKEATKKDEDSQYNHNESSSERKGNKKKLFDKNEGEYIDFEEIKE